MHGTLVFWHIIDSPLVTSVLWLPVVAAMAYEMTRDVLRAGELAEDLRESEKRFRATFEQAAMGIAHVSPEGRFLRVNQRFCDIAGYSHAEMLERTFQEITYPDDLAVDLLNVNQLLSGERDAVSLEKRYVRKNGDLVWINLTAALVRDQAGQPQWFIAVIEDIGSRKQAEEKVRQLSHAMENSPVLVVITDLQGTIIYVNRKFCEVTGYSYEESIGRNPRFLKSGESPPEMYEELWARITRGETWRGEFHNRKKNGELYWESAVISPLLDADGRATHFVGVKLDITESKRAELENEQQRHQMAHLSRDRNDERVVEFAGARTEPAPGHHSHQCPGSAAASRATAARCRRGARHSHGHRQRRPAGGGSHPAIAIAAQAGTNQPCAAGLE